MKRASYREAVAWIALNDSAGEDELDPKAVSELVSSALVADIFGVTEAKVAEDVIRYRRRNPS